MSTTSTTHAVDLAPDSVPAGSAAELSLTREERTLLRLMVLGQSPAQIALAMGRSLPETQAGLERLQQRFGVSGRHALVVHAVVHRCLRS